MKFFKRILPGLAAALLSSLAQAGSSLPLDRPISTPQSNLIGHVVMGISVVAFLAGGVALAFVDELGGIAKKVLYVVLIIAMIAFGNSFLTLLGLVNAGAVLL